MLYIHLDTLATELHTLIGLWQAALALRLCGLIHTQPTQYAEQCASGTCVTVVLYEMDIQHIQSHFLVLAGYPPYQRIFFASVLLGVMMRTAALLSKRGNGSVIPLSPPPYAFAAYMV